ncbi:MAG: SPOR domain-containing protein [Nitrospinae bacterium]|nr:SPOR domain-containing protein [Nitrospinota bacterium]
MKKFVKLFLTLLVLGGAGAAVYMGGKKDVSFFHALGEPKKAVAEKKVSPVKPKAAPKGGPGSSGGENSPKEFDYTFFETLNDPSMTKMVGLDNRLRSLPSSSPEKPRDSAAPAKENKTTSVVGADGGKGHAAPIPKPATTVSAPTPAASSAPSPSAEGDYAVQVSSFRDLVRAQGLQARLQRKGYPAFLLTAELPAKGGLLYRVFLGKYPGPEKANDIAQKVKRDERLEAVVVLLPD